MRLIVLAVSTPLSNVLTGRTTGRLEALAALTDEALMVRFGTGDTDAFEALYRRHRARLHRFLRRMNPVDTDEIFQEVWLAVIAGRERYVPSARFVTYLFSIAHRRASDRWRRRARADESALASVDHEAVLADLLEPLDPLGATLNAELGAALDTAIARLPTAQREAFLLQAEGGLSLEEIAQASGTGRETVKSRLRYAHERLRSTLESWT
jgi:RNA polymerase sigma-70 factor (ECF subfamily)